MSCPTCATMRAALEDLCEQMNTLGAFIGHEANLPAALIEEFNEADINPTVLHVLMRWQQSLLRIAKARHDMFHQTV